jgi:uncharacterized protein YjlB
MSPSTSPPATVGHKPGTEFHHVTQATALPLVVHRAALETGADAAERCEALFQRNGWGDGWRAGVYPYHHFHAETHEVLGIVSGEAKVRFGGAAGPLVGIAAGDVVVIPAGVSHKNEGASRDFLAVGAYPRGRRPDMNRGTPEEEPNAAGRIRRVPLPGADPVFGAKGPLIELWSKAGGEGEG